MSSRLILTIALFLFLSNAYSQNLDSDIEDRIRTLEASVASLDTRLEARTTAGSGSLDSSVAGLSVQRRIDGLQRQVESLTRQVEALQRRVEQAGRDAAGAIREAEAARRDARDALARAR